MLKTAEGLVLTEWKKVGDDKDPKTVFEQGLNQAKIYSSSSISLPGTELSSVRFIVLVSKKKLVLPTASIDGGIEYRPINIIVDPDPPSQH